ncbi:MAG: helix-turn-helix domain containing protein, partial [Dysgonamonadaceae bacterium]|nr:helix-turn-helix domain containing protein [Dysgonamonadaceae bacterium]
MTVKERLIQYIKFKGITQSNFCKSIGVSVAFITSMRVSMQPDKIKSISLKYPELNIHWLLTGNGEMFKEPQPSAPS